MKKIILGAVLLVSACTNLTFDNYEYSRFVDIKYVADIRQTVCDDEAAIAVSQSTLKEMIDRQLIYSQYRTDKPLVFSSTQALYEIITDFALKDTMSKTYCLKKLENISSGSALILETLGTLK